MSKPPKIRTAMIAVASFLYCVPTPAHAEDRWWRPGATSEINLAQSDRACGGQSGDAVGVDRIGCGITAVLTGREARAQDYFVLVTDDDARACLPQNSPVGIAPAHALLGAYCAIKVGDFARGRALLEPLKPPAGDAGAAWRFEMFRVAALAYAVNGEGDADKAIAMLRSHPQFAASDVLRQSLIAILVMDERQPELARWWSGPPPVMLRDPVLQALCVAQVALAGGSVEAARHALDAVSGGTREGSKAVKVARYRVSRLRNGADSASAGDHQGRFSSTVTAAPQFLQTTENNQYNFAGLLSARGVDFKIDPSKLNRPGVALPIGFFF